MEAFIDNNLIFYYGHLKGKGSTPYQRTIFFFSYHAQHVEKFILWIKNLTFINHDCVNTELDRDSSVWRDYVAKYLTEKIDFMNYF